MSMYLLLVFLTYLELHILEFYDVLKIGLYVYRHKFQHKPRAVTTAVTLNTAVDAVLSYFLAVLYF